MTLSARILLSLVLGLAAGLFFGELVEPLKIVGDAFVLLLQMTVLPYVATSLVAGLGSLDVQEARRLALHGGAVLLLLWGSALTVVVLFPFCFPDWESASFFSTNLVRASEGFDFLGLFIPSNPFHSLSEAIVPSVVVFSVAVGIALIRIEEKAEMMAVLSTLQDALSRITAGVVQLAPLGIFAIATYAAGTLSIDQAASLQVYMAAYAGSALVLGLWTIPGLIATLTDSSYREVMRHMRGSVITAFATGSVFVVLSILAARSKELLATETEHDPDTDRIIDVMIPVAFTFPSAGKLLTLAFVLFAGWVAGYALSPAQYPSLVIAGVPSLFGATVVAIPFLLDLFQIPSDTFQLFLVADNVVGNRFGAMVASMHLVAMALITAAAVAGRIRIRPVALVRYAVVTVVLTALPVLAVRATFESLGHDYAGYDRFVSMSPLFAPTESRELEVQAPPEDTSRRTLDRIQERGAIRIGYLPDRLPWAFRDTDGELVGFDIEMAHRLATELGVRLESIELERDAMVAALNAGSVDVAMSGIPLTTDLLAGVTVSPSYLDETIAFIVRDHDRDQYATREAIKQLRSPRIAVPRTRYYTEKLAGYLPSAELRPVDSARDFFRAPPGEYDALLYTAESGSAWSLVYPKYTVAVPQPDILKVPLVYVVRKGDDAMADFLAAWIELKRRDGSFDRLFRHWILGQAVDQEGERWSVIRDVLGWVE